MRKEALFLVLIISFFQVDRAYAQLHQLPAARVSQMNNMRTMDDIDSTQIYLPFWDDFSTVVNTPDPEKWLCCDDVLISPGIGINPPTINVASFDGWNYLAIPHNQSLLSRGGNDSLVSRFIDLSAIALAQRNTMFLSFFYQKEGHGSRPSPSDSIRLQVKDNANQWRTIWKISGAETTETNEFTQVIVPIHNAAFFHPWFQFRFQSFGLLSGPYNNWNIDYIYLNTSRNQTDLAYEDRALTSLPSSPFKKYTAVPMEFFRENPDYFTGQATVDFYNVDALLQPIEYTAKIQYADQSEELDVMNTNTVLNPNPLGFERRQIVANKINIDNLPLEEDSLYLETLFWISSGDSIFQEKIDYRVNDTVRSQIILDKELAYDDGGAEYIAGMNQNGGNLAVRFVIPGQGILRAIKIHFPQVPRTYGNSAGQPFRLKIWNKLDGEFNSLVHQQQTVVLPPSTFSEFGEYQLSRPIAVSDTFYIGYEQFVGDFFYVGLDKNTDSSEEIFSNTRGVWEQNIVVKGSLLIRAVFGDGIITQLPEVEMHKIDVYPNPSEGYLYVKGSYESLSITDITGRKVQFNTDLNQGTIDLSGHPAGVYIFRFIEKGQIISKKVVIQ